MYCPICRYDLTCLPDFHRCPECGFESDPTGIVYEFMPHSWWGYVVMPGFVVPMAVGGRSTGLRQALWVVVGTGLLCMTWSLLAQVRHGVGACVVNRNGVFISYSKAVTHRFGWEMVNSAERGSFFGGLILHGDDGRILHPCMTHHFGRRGRVERCVRDINRLAKAHRAGNLAQALTEVGPVEPPGGVSAP